MIEIGNIGSTPIEKVLEIIDTSDNVVAKYAIGEKDSLTKMLMQDHNVSISFNYPTFISFKKGYYLTFNGIKYWLMNDYKAVESNGEYRYELVFHAKEMLFQDVQYWYDKNNVDQSEYGLTGNASYFLQLAVENVNKHYGANFVNQGTAEPTDIKYIQFANNTNVLDALGQVCDTFDCEWMLVGDTINIIEKANFGDAIDFRVGETVLKIDRREGEDKFDANRILALGSTLNLTEAYQGGDYMIGSKRLRIPTSKGKYIDLKPNLKPTEVKTATVIFDDIYPKRVGNIDAVREIEYNVDENGKEVTTVQYRFKDNGIVFSDDYLLPNEPLMVVFETGELAGLHFELYFSKDGYSETDNSQYYEILVNNTYGSQLPNETLKPEIGNKYVLYNFNIELVSHIYIPEAENELFEYATRWLKNEWVDKGVYECPIMGRYARDNDVNLEIGQRVDLYSPLFSDATRQDGKRESRVMGYVKPLISTFDAVYTIGDNKAYSPKSNIQQRITKLEATEYAVGGIGVDDGSVYIIKQFDNTLPTDFNVYSAKATDAKYLNKQKGGSVLGDTLFTKNVQTQGLNISDVFQNSTFTAGAFGTGFQIKNDTNGYSYGELDYLRVRKEMIVSQLTIDEIKSVGGTILLSLASLTASNVIDNGTSYRVYFDNQDGKLLNKFVVGDQAIRQTFNGANIVRYWRLVTGVGIDYIDLSKTDAEQGSSIPLVGDEIIQLGNRSNVMRQHAILLSAYGSDAPSIKQYSDINSFSLLNKEATVISPSGNKFKGTFEITSNGTTTVVYKDRGKFVNGTTYYKNDRVSHNGSLWVCNVTSTTVTPNESTTAWTKETSGDSDINNAIGNVSIGGTNLIIKNNLKNGYIEVNTGVEEYHSSLDVYDPNYYTIVGINKSLIATVYDNLSVPTGGSGYVFFYDANKNYLGRLAAWCTGGTSGSTKIGSTIYEIPPLARFYRYSIIHKDLICQIEYGNKATSYSLSPQDIQKDIDNAQNIANSSKNYIDNVLQNELDEIRDQIDGKVNSYFYDYDPTVNNIPASEWITEQQKEDHLNDTFTNTYSGMSWRWLKVNGVYDWVVISDTAATEALAKAAEALQTANNKMQVFVQEPYTPYKVGDLWVQGANGDILRCNVTRLSGDFDANDWGKASNYTDDTLAEQIGSDLERFTTQTTAKFQVLDDKVESKVDSQTFNQLNQLVSTHSSQITQLDESITSTVEKVDNIKIGGVNLVNNSKGSWGRTSYGLIRTLRLSSPLIVGGIYILTWKGVKKKGVLSVFFDMLGVTVNRQNARNGIPFIANREYPYLTFFAELANEIDLEIAEVKVEKGNKATDWSPSPEDVQSGIDAAQNTANSKTRTYGQDTTPTVPSGGHTVGDTWYYESLVDFDGNINTDVSKNVYQLVRRWNGSDWVRINWSASKSKIEQTDSQIKQTVEKTGIDQLGQGENLYSVFDQRADEIVIEVSSVEQKANNAQGTANTAQDKANKAEQDALNAKNIADSKTTEAEVKAGIKVTPNGVNVYGNEFKVDSTLIANAIETDELSVGDGNFRVDENGHITAKGANIQGEYTNISGNGHININKDSNGVTARDMSNRDIAKLGFFSGGGGEVRVASNKIYSESFNDETVLTGAGIYCESYTVSAPSTRRFSVVANRSRSWLEIIMLDLPTSKSGLDKGQLWRDGEFLKIVP